MRDERGERRDKRGERRDQRCFIPEQSAELYE